MNTGRSECNSSSSLGKYFLGWAVFWTTAIVGLFVLGMIQNRSETRVLASTVAQAHFDKERALRLWAASHGGIYVPADERNPPNPLLEDLPERDIRTPSGALLTLVPGFHLVRLIQEEYPELYGVKGATTSLRPLRPENAPDEWQKLALESFQKGEKEVSEFTEISGEPYLRLMRPHVPERGCLKCHAKTSSVEGNLLGGVEVSLPLKPLLHHERKQTILLAVSYAATFLIGLLGLLVWSRKLKERESRQNTAEIALRTSEERYRELVEMSQDIVYRTDDRGLFTFVSQSAAKITGFSEGELIGLHYTDLILPEYRKEAERFYVRQFVDKIATTYYEFPFQTKTGAVIWVGQNVTLLVGNQDVVGFQAIARDITERKRLDQIMQARLRLMEIVDSSSLEELLRLTLDEAERLTGSNIGFYHYVDSDEKAVTLYAWSTNTFEKMCTSDGAGQHYSIDQAGVWVDCIRERKTVIYNDYASLSHRKGTPEGHAPLVRLMLTPVFRSDKIVAIVGIGNKAAGYDRHDQETLRMLADLSWDIAERKQGAVALRESEERYRSLVEHSFDGIFIHDGTQIVFVNSSLCEMLGYEKGELEGNEHWAVYDPAYQDLARERVHARIRGESVSPRHEVKLKRKDGASFEGEITARAVNLNGVPGVQVWVRDISDSKKHENALIQAKDEWERTFNAISDFILILDSEHRIIRANKAMAQALGMSQADLAGKYCYELMHGSQTPPSFCPHAKLLEDGQEHSVEVNEPHINGLLEVRVSPIVDRYGLVSGSVHIARDISEKKRAEEALRESEARYRELFEHASDFIYTHDLDGNYTSVNKSVGKLLGYETQELLGLNFRSIVEPEYLSETEQNLRRKLSERCEVTGPYEIAVRSKYGVRLWLEVTSRIIRKDGNPIGVHGIARDISRRKAIEAALHEAQMKYQSMMESFDGLIYLCSQNYEIEFANQRLVERTGYDPVGQKCFEALHQLEDICPWCVNERVFRGETVRRESYSPKDNRWYHFINSPVRHADGMVSKLTLAQDITEQKNAEEEKEVLKERLFQSQKMEAIGTLAGGIAHDFNNLLQVISGYSDMLQMNPRLEEKTLSGLNRIAQAAWKGASLVKGLLTLGGRVESQRKPINMNQQVDEVVKLLSRTIPKIIELEFHLDEDLPLINGDPVQAHQILMNLGINARDAMPNGGKLVFKTTKVILDETYCRTHVEAEPGTYVLLSVSDTGTGMDQETAAHIFEPFFTTKPVGAGSGLGLSIVYGIVKQHEGFVRCDSEPGRGTTFEVYLPVTDETGDLSEDDSLDALPPGGSETLLLVDDDEVVRELAESMFVEMGYTVFTAANGKEAVEKYRIERERISLVILDLTMPEMDGQRCLKEILKMDSSAKVLIASGHAENNLAKETIERGAKGFVHKPYEVRDLLQMIREVLDRE